MSPVPLCSGLTFVAVLLLWPGSPRPGVAGPRPRVWALPVLALAAVLIRPGHATVLVLLAAGVAWGGRILWGQRVRAREAEVTGALVVEVCDLVAAELASGQPSASALDQAATVWPALLPVAETSRLGGDVPAALCDVAARPGADGLRLLSGAWAVSHRTGAGLAESARRVADATRRDLATRRVVSAELASARATSRLVALLPLLALSMGSGAGADPWAFLLATPLGLACLVAGSALGLAGLWWIELIARDVGG